MVLPYPLLKRKSVMFVDETIRNIAQSDLGTNVYPLYEVTSKVSNGTMVDLGVRCGNSSEIMLIASTEKNNKVYGVDITFDDLRPDLHNRPNYNKILGDSCTVGNEWTGDKVDVLFVDTFHIKEQVMCELYYWYPHMKDDCWFVFHDSNWPNGKHDVYGGIVWDRVEEGIMSFFGLKSLTEKTEELECFHYPSSWGMTFVHVKKHADFPSRIDNWDHIIQRRNHLISLFWNSENIGERNINLKLKKI